VSGENALLASANYGAFVCRVTGISHGMKITGEQQDARASQTFLTSRVVEDNFILSIAFAGFQGYQAFGEWMKGYIEAQSGVDSTAKPMRVIVPARGFDKIGIPTSPIPFGDDIAVVVHKVKVTFVATIDPNPTNFSRYFPALNDTIFAPYFYPAGTQLSANSPPGVDFFYDNPGYFTPPAGPADFAVYPTGSPDAAILQGGRNKAQ
jgi:hypothetical protein